MPRTEKALPFAFVVDSLHPLPVRVQAFFGGQMVYLLRPEGEWMLFLLYDRPRWPESRGVWLATAPEHLSELESEYRLRPVPIDEFTLKGWRMIGPSDPHFEATLAHWVQRVHAGDRRLGRPAPARKRRKASPSGAGAESF